MSTHRHTSHEHEHEFEPQHGLPETLPDGERILWQGSPAAAMLARDVFHVRKLAVYFAALVAWRVVSSVTHGDDAMATAIAGAIAVALAAAALGLVTLLARLSASTSVYTITNRRVVMRVGIVLSVTFNLPLKKIEGADLHALADGYGDIALKLEPATRIAYAHLWPHARPWHVARTQPSLRSIADAETVAQTLTRAWRAETGATVTTLQPKARPQVDVPLDVAEAA